METSTRVRGREGYQSDGVSGLKALGVRDLNHRLSFLACSVQPTKPGVSKKPRGQGAAKPRGQHNLGGRGQQKPRGQGQNKLSLSIIIIWL